MKTRLGIVMGMLAMLSVGGFAQDDVRKERKGDNLVEVTVTGQGASKDDAMMDAKRKAVEEGAGTFLSSQTKVKDSVLINDTILAKSAGFIKEFKVTKRAKEIEDGVWEVTIKAQVSIQGVEDEWATVKTMLEQVGRPKIAVFLDESIDHVLVANSTVKIAMQDRLLKSGFLLVSPEQMKAINAKDLQAAMAEDKPDKLQAIAKRFAAQIFIKGTADAVLSSQFARGSSTFFAYEADANIEVYRTDDAQLISSVPTDSLRGTDRSARAAAKAALVEIGGVVAKRVTLEMLQSWQDSLMGGGEVKLEIESITYNQLDDVEKALGKLKDITGEPSSDFNNKTGEVSLQSRIPAKKLAKKISKAIKNLEVIGVTQNVIKCKYVGKGGDEEDSE